MTCTSRERERENRWNEKRMNLCLFNHIIRTKKETNSEKKTGAKISLGKTQYDTTEQRLCVLNVVFFSLLRSRWSFSSRFTRNADFYRCNFGASEQREKKRKESCRTFWVWCARIFAFYFVSFVRSSFDSFISKPTRFVQFPKRQSNRLQYVVYLLLFLLLCFLLSFFCFNLFLHFIRALVHWVFGLNHPKQLNNS